MTRSFFIFLRLKALLILSLLTVTGTWAQSLPLFELDPIWPQVPLNENWLTGGIGGMCVGQQDEVYL